MRRLAFTRSGLGEMEGEQLQPHGSGGEAEMVLDGEQGTEEDRLLRRQLKTNRQAPLEMLRIALFLAKFLDHHSEN